jgi:hypothetical protein
VAKYDAFGREIGEDTLSGLGGGSVVEQPASDIETSTLADDPAVAAPPPQPAAARPPRSARRTRRSWRLAVFFVILGLGIQGAVRSGVDLDGDDTTAVAPAKPFVVGEEPAEGASLLTAKRFGAAMDKLRASGPGRLFTLRLAADRIDVQVDTPDGKIRVVQVSRALEVRTLTTVQGGFGVDTFSFDAVRPGAPARLIRAAARRLHQPRSNVDYLVVTPFDDEISWAVYFKNGRYALGDARGRLQRVY